MRIGEGEIALGIAAHPALVGPGAPAPLEAARVAARAPAVRVAHPAWEDPAAVRAAGAEAGGGE